MVVDLELEAQDWVVYNAVRTQALKRLSLMATGVSLSPSMQPCFSQQRNLGEEERGLLLG